MNVLRYAVCGAFLAATFHASFVTRCFAAEPLPAAIAEAEVAAWIRDLDSARFSDRQRASTALTRVGQKAIPALTEAAIGGSREASTRATMILKSHFEGRTEVARDRAEASLERIAASGKPAAAIAKRALHPAPGQAAVRSFVVEPGVPAGDLDVARVQGAFTAPDLGGK